MTFCPSVEIQWNAQYSIFNCYLGIVVFISFFSDGQNKTHWPFGYHRFGIWWLQSRYLSRVLELKIQDESDNEEESESLLKNLEQYEEKSKPNLEEAEIINIGTGVNVKKIKINTHLNEKQKKCYNKKVRLFEEGDKVLKWILPEEAEGKFAPNWQSSFTVKKVLLGGAPVLAEMDE